MVWADSHKISRASWYLGNNLFRSCLYSDTRLSLSSVARSRAVLFKDLRNRIKPLIHRLSPLPSYCNAWLLTQHEFLAVPVSLTTTQGITFVFFSSRYLDVSVHAVAFFTLYIQIKMSRVCLDGFPHSDIFGSTLG